MVIETTFHGLQRPQRTPMREHVYGTYLFKSKGSHLVVYDLIRLRVANTTNKNARDCTMINTTNRRINIMHILRKSREVVRLSLYITKDPVRNSCDGKRMQYRSYFETIMSVCS